jgi:hypothetical protein
MVYVDDEQKTFIYAAGTLQEPISFGGNVSLRTIPMIMSFPSAGAATFQITCSSKEDIDGGTAVWADSPDGEVSATTYVTLNANPSAVRISRASGTVRLDIVLRP